MILPLVSITLFWLQLGPDFLVLLIDFTPRNDIPPLNKFFLNKSKVQQPWGSPIVKRVKHLTTGKRTRRVGGRPSSRPSRNGSLVTASLFFNARERKSERSEHGTRGNGGGQTSQASQLRRIQSSPATLSNIPFCAGVNFSRDCIRAFN